jgi:hypothetical protein
MGVGPLYTSAVEVGDWRIGEATQGQGGGEGLWRGAHTSGGLGCRHRSSAAEECGGRARRRSTRVSGALMSGLESTVMGGGGGFDLDSNFERIQINFKSLQTLTGPKGTLPRSKNLK